MMGHIILLLFLAFRFRSIYLMVLISYMYDVANDVNINYFSTKINKYIQIKLFFIKENQNKNLVFFCPIKIKTLDQEHMNNVRHL